MIEYAISDLFFYLYFYSFYGWLIEIIFSTLNHQKVIHHGFLNCPAIFPYGISSVILILAFPTFKSSLLLQFVVSFTIFHTIWSISEVFVHNICGFSEELTSNILTLTWKSQLIFVRQNSLLIYKQQPTYFMNMAY